MGLIFLLFPTQFCDKSVHVFILVCMCASVYMFVYLFVLVCFCVHVCIFECFCVLCVPVCFRVHVCIFVYQYSSVCACVRWSITVFPLQPLNKFGGMSNKTTEENVNNCPTRCDYIRGGVGTAVPTPPRQRSVANRFEQCQML